MNIRALAASLLPLVTLPLFATACVIETGPAPTTAQAGKMEVIEADTTTPVQLAAGLADGKPPRLKPSAAMSYWVWHGARNDWHVRSTTWHQLHRFQGRIHPLENASLSNLKATRLEWGDRMRLQGQDIVFDFSTQGGEDGFDFTLNGSACVEMNLRIDATAHPKLVIIGKTEEVPTSAHFIVCP